MLRSLPSSHEGLVHQPHYVWAALANSSGYLVTTNVVYWLVRNLEDANLGRSGA